MPYEIQVFHRDKQMLAPPELQKIHPLGKSPVISVTPARGGEPIILAESGHMVQYLTEHLPEGKRLTPQRWKDGMEGQVGGETEGWMRHQYYLHYCEGSLMPFLVMCLVIEREFHASCGCNRCADTLTGLKTSDVPFFVRPITSIVADRIFSTFIFPNVHKHFTMLEQQLSTSPDGGKYLCGNHLTAADILMSFPVIASKHGRLNEIGPWKDGDWKKEFPRLATYTATLEAEQGYKTSVAKMEELDGKFEVAP